MQLTETPRDGSFLTSNSLVSVVIPLFNKGPYVERALSSALSQDHPPLEIIVVDDRSTDDGPERVRRCRDPRVALVENPVNLGPGAARNRGLALARGRYIAFLDADDEWHRGFLSTAVSRLEAAPAVALACMGYEWRPAPPREIARRARLEGIYEITESSSPALLSAIEVFASLCFTVMRTDAARRWGGYFEKDRCLRGEDQYFLLKLLLNEKVCIVPESYGVYHTDASALCGNAGEAIPAIEPCLSYSAGLVEACPRSKRGLLRRFLKNRALNRTLVLIKLGDRRLARESIKTLLRSDRGDLRLHLLHALAGIAAIVPSLRSARTRLLECSESMRQSGHRE